MIVLENCGSHLFKAPLSGNQEVSGFGDGGEGDSGDNWFVECDGSQKLWLRGVPVYFKHVDTGKYLYTAENVKFNQQNCGGGCPIMVRIGFKFRVSLKQFLAGPNRSQRWGAKGFKVQVGDGTGSLLSPKTKLKPCETVSISLLQH